MKEDCIFCKIAHKEISAELVYEDDEVIAFKDAAPVAPIHFLFIPKKHIETLNDLSVEDQAIMGKILEKVKEVARKEAIEQAGYRVVINCNKNAGQVVFHLHVHLLGGRNFTWPPG